MTISNYEIYNDDCINKLKQLKETNCVVDAIITDPPYNISKENNFSTMKSANRQGVDFGEWDKNFDVTKWIEYSSDLLKDGGNMLIFNSFLHFGEIANELTKLGYQIKDLIRWIKPNPMPRNTDRRFVVDYEFCLWAVKGKKKWTFNILNKPYMKPEIVCPTPSGRERTAHPTQKPLKLMEKLVKIFSNENEIILDPFMGSGSTGVACIENNRKFLGIEKEKLYFNLSKERLSKINK